MKYFFIFLHLLAFSGFAQTAQEILQGQYADKLQEWPERAQFVKDWQDCQNYRDTIEAGLKKAKGDIANARLSKKSKKLFEELLPLIQNDSSGDAYAKVRNVKQKFALKLNDVVQLKDIYSWDVHNAFCQKRVPEVEKWAKDISESAQAFPDDFKAGYLRERMNIQRVEKLFGKPTNPKFYSPYDSLVNEVGVNFEKSNKLISPSNREAFYAQLKKIYKEGIYKDTVVTTKGRITRTIVYHAGKMQVFEIQNLGDSMRFWFIDGIPVGEDVFDSRLKEAKGKVEH